MTVAQILHLSKSSSKPHRSAITHLKRSLPFLISLTAITIAYTQPALAESCTLGPTGICSAECTADNGQKGVWLTIAVNGKHCVPNGGATNQISQNVIFIYLIGIIKFLTGGAGILAVGGVVWGGIMYATAGGNTSQIQKAVKIILNAVIGLLLFFILAALFNFIIPGRVFL